MEEYKRLIGLFKQLKTETNDLYNQWYPERSDKTLFVDEIRKITKTPSNLEQMITYIKEAASIIVGNIPINGDGCYSIPEYQQAKAMAIEALEQQPCEDCISRQAVLSYICNDLEFGDKENGCNLERKIAQEEIYNFIKKMPSVTPKEKTEYEHDHEIVKAYNDGQAFVLDKIRAEIRAESKKNYTNNIFNKGLYRAIEIIDKYRGDTDGYKYCPDCGARMEG